MKLEIKHISNLGVGIAIGAELGKKSNKIFVSKTITGDEIEARITKKSNKFTVAKLEKIIKKSDLRKDAECEYFDRCGGCSLQHLKDDFYLDFKKKNIREAIARNNLDFNDEINFIEIGKNSRRRVSFHVTNDNNLGFFQENSNELVKISHCLMLEKDLSDLIPDLQNLLNNLPSGIIDSISICKFDNVLDVVFGFKKLEISIEVSEKLSEFAERNGNVNLSSKFTTSITPIFQKFKPRISLGEINIDLPNGVFLQATKKGQEAIIKQISEFVKNNKIENVVDIYSGIGTYGFSILNNVSKISAFEGERRMVNVINKNAKSNIISHKIEAFKRDLDSNPLQEDELHGFDLAIINPPRNGARYQSLKLAKSSIRNIIMVSCDLVTFARDAKILIDSGFKIDKLTSIDQFYYTPHIELVAIFTKELNLQISGGK